MTQNSNHVVMLQKNKRIWDNPVLINDGEMAAVFMRANLFILNVDAHGLQPSVYFMMIRLVF